MNETGFKSQLPLRYASTGTLTRTLDHSHIFVTSKELDWRGIYLEGGINEGWEADDLTVDGHYVAVNLADVPLPMMSRTRSGLDHRLIS